MYYYSLQRRIKRPGLVFHQDDQLEIQQHTVVGGNQTPLVDMREDFVQRFLRSLSMLMTVNHSFYLLTLEW